jgi:hypothetical protein
MNRKMAFVALCVGALGTFRVLAAAFGAGVDKEPREPIEPGSIMPCSLVGVNPVYHPEVFANPATAREFGFIRAKDGTWQVIPNCHPK